MQTPYEFYDGKLGVKIAYLINDRNKHEDSLDVIKYNTLYRRIESHSSNERMLRRSSPNHEALVVFDSLPREWREALIRKFGKPVEEAKKSWFAQHYAYDGAAHDFFIKHRFEDGSKLTDKHIEKFTQNASVLNTALIVKENRSNYIKTLGVKKVDVWQALSNDINAFREVEHDLPTNKDALRRKLTRYKKEGYVSLIDGKLANSNAKKVVDEEQLAVLDELLAKHTNLSHTQVADLYNEICKYTNWKTITPQTVANRLEKQQLVITAGRNGMTALNNKVKMQNKREKPSSAMLYWTLDGWDVELLYQKQTTNAKGHQVTTYHNRLTAVILLDPFNKYPVGYAIGTHETPELIKEALKNAFLHLKQLFGNYYKPYQLQSDHYGKGTLEPLYQACTQHYTPARVKNAKSKVIEPYFNTINTSYFKLFDNWSGHNVSSGSKNQPNSDYLNQIRHTFPDEEGCRKQIIGVLELERSKKQIEFIRSFEKLDESYKNELTQEAYLLAFGGQTGYTNRLQPDGLHVTLMGQRLVYDSFDLNFRKLAHLDWKIRFDTNDLTQVLAVSEDGKYRFELEQKQAVAMALADRKEGDAAYMARVESFNKEIEQEVIEQRTSNQQAIETLFKREELGGTLSKHLLLDSSGQHKNQKSEQRIGTTKDIEYKDVEQAPAKSKQQEHLDYLKNKTDFNKYLNP